MEMLFELYPSRTTAALAERASALQTDAFAAMAA